MIDYDRAFLVREKISLVFLKFIIFLNMYCHFGLCFNVVLRKSITIVSQLRTLQILLRKRYVRLYR